jgi:hypothetical protein
MVCRQTCVAFAAATAFLVIATASTNGEAAENATSPYLKGYKDFLSGVLPPEPGLYIQNDTIYY